MWLQLQCNRPITGAEGSYKASDGQGSIYHTVFVRGFATTSVATHLTLTYGFPHIWLSEPGGCIGPTEPLAECQRHSPQGLVMHYRGSNLQSFDYRPSKPPLHHQFHLILRALKTPAGRRTVGRLITKSQCKRSQRAQTAIATVFGFLRVFNDLAHI